MTKKRLTTEEFMRLMVNKELELAGADTDYDTIKASDDKQWYDHYCFTSEDQVKAFKEFFLQHHNEYAGRTSKRMMEEDFGYWFLGWGLRENY